MPRSVEVWQWKTWRMVSYLSKFSSQKFILIRTLLSCCNAREKSLTKSSSSFVCPTFGMLKSSVLPVKFLCYTVEWVMFMCQCVLLVSICVMYSRHSTVILTWFYHVSMGTNVAYVGVTIGVTMDASTHQVVQLLPYMDIYFLIF